MTRMRFAVVGVLVLALTQMGCGPAEPEDQLASDVYGIVEPRVSPGVEVEAAEAPNQEGWFDVVVAFAMFVGFDSSGALNTEHPDNVRTMMYRVILEQIIEFRTEGLGDQIETLTFRLLHPESDEVLMEVDFARDVWLEFDPQDVEEFEEIRDAIPTVATTLHDHFDPAAFEELVEFYGREFE